MANEVKVSTEVDMTSEGIDRRFRMVESLRKLCVSLQKAGEQSIIRESNTTSESSTCSSQDRVFVEKP